MQKYDQESKIKHAKYYSIVLDTTPDVVHMDQLVFIIRYVDDLVKPLECFMGDLPNVGHKSQEMEKTVISVLLSHHTEL